MSRFVILVVLAVFASCAFAAPADETTVATTTTAKPADERQALVSDGSFFDTFLSGGKSWTVLTGSLAALLIIGGLGLAFYYFYYLNYYGYSGAEAFSGYNPGTATGYPTSYNYYPAARALPGGSFSFARVLDLIAMAQETYEKFDFQSLDCQKKALCDLQQKQNDFGEAGRKISSSFSLMDTLEGLPMPTIIQTYLKEYKDAIIQGKNSSKDCASIYPKCDFSIKEVFVKYTKKGKKQQ